MYISKKKSIFKICLCGRAILHFLPHLLELKSESLFKISDISLWRRLPGFTNILLLPSPTDDQQWYSPPSPPREREAGKGGWSVIWLTDKGERCQGRKRGGGEGKVGRGRVNNFEYIYPPLPFLYGRYYKQERPFFPAARNAKQEDCFGTIPDLSWDMAKRTEQPCALL